MKLRPPLASSRYFGLCRRGVLRLGLHTSQRQLNPLAPDDQKSEKRAPREAALPLRRQGGAATGERRLAARALSAACTVSASRDAARATRRARRDARSTRAEGG